jgi:hypothetical protein
MQEGFPLSVKWQEKFSSMLLKSEDISEKLLKNLTLHLPELLNRVLPTDKDFSQRGLTPERNHFLHSDQRPALDLD